MKKYMVLVLDYNDEDKRISLGMKQLTEHPWNSLDENLDIGSVVKGNIVNVADYGAFLELTPDVGRSDTCIRDVLVTTPQEIHQIHNK